MIYWINIAENGPPDQTCIRQVADAAGLVMPAAYDIDRGRWYHINTNAVVPNVTHYAELLPHPDTLGPQPNVGPIFRVIHRMKKDGEWFMDAHHYTDEGRAIDMADRIMAQHQDCEAWAVMMVAVFARVYN